MKKLKPMKWSFFVLAAVAFGATSATTLAQDCDFEVEILLTPGSWPSEVSWALADNDGTIVAEGDNPEGIDVVTTFCLDTSACYTLFMVDSFGDGWNGATLTFNAEELGWMSPSFTIETGNEAVAIVGFGDCGQGEEAVVSGCTDPLAWNYNPLATEDDDSCEYGNGGGWNCECDSSWYEPVCAFDPITGQAQDFENWCEAECAGAIVLADGACENFGWPGCTDPEALNYDPNATEDNGSCTYPCAEGSETAMMYVCTFQQGANVSLTLTNQDTGEVVYEQNGYSNYAIEYLDLCLAEGCYTATLTNLAGETSWYNGYFYINAEAGQIIHATLSDDATTMTIAFSTDGSCGDIIGCTDAEAPNYNPDATVDDGSCLPTCECDDEAYEPVCAYDPFTYELITFPNLCEALCIGAYVQFNDDCSNPPVYGCTDPEALNYNADATEDDYSCVFPLQCDEASTLVTITSNVLELDSNAFGADFNVVPAVSWNIGDSTGFGVYMTYWYDESQAMNAQACLADGCYNFVVQPASWGWYDETIDPELFFATVTFDGESTNYFYNFEDNGLTTFGLGVNSPDCSPYVPVHGCTDPEADNFNPSANVDDGSCFYSIECGDGELTLTSVFIPGLWANEVSFYVLNEAGEIVLSGEGESQNNEVVSQSCVVPGCYTFVAVDSWGDGWNNGLAILEWGSGAMEFGLETGEQSSTVFGIEATGCGTPAPLVGCTDLGATNYNPSATEDDGSCEFAFCPTNEVTFVTVMMGDGMNAGWFIGNDENPAMGGASGFANDSQTWTACMASGCYDVHMWDEESNGWDGGWIEVWMDSTLMTTATLEDGVGATMTLGIDSDCGDGETDGWGFGGSPFEWPDPIGLVPFPNPTEGGWNFDGSGFNEMKPIVVKVHDLAGKLVLEVQKAPTGGTIQMEDHQLAPGVYTVEAVQGKQVGQGQLHVVR